MNDILFGNNNKAVIKKLANRSFRSNKMRNVIAVIAIALTTFLFTAVLTIGMGAKGTLEYNMAKMIGTGADALVQGPVSYTHLDVYKRQMLARSLTVLHGKAPPCPFSERAGLLETV